MTVHEEIDLLTPGPELDICLVQHLEEEVDSLKSKIAIVTDEVLSLPEDKGLMYMVSQIEKALVIERLKIKRMLHKQASSPKTG